MFGSRGGGSPLASGEMHGLGGSGPPPPHRVAHGIGGYSPPHASAGLRAWRTLGSDACVQRERIGPASGAPQTSAAARGGNSLSWARTRVRTRFGLNAQRETFSDAVREGPHRSAFPAWRPRWVHRTAPFASSRREGESITKGGFASGGQQPKLPHRSLMVKPWGCMQCCADDGQHAHNPCAD